MGLSRPAFAMYANTRKPTPPSAAAPAQCAACAASSPSFSRPGASIQAVSPASRPVVSVIIASYNHGAYIGQALESILAQTVAAFEVIVVDDGSVDDSWRTIQNFAARDGRIKALQHPDGRNHGLCATLSLSLQHCRGDYVAFLESDDFWKPDCLEKRLAALNRSNAGAVFNSVEIMRMQGARADGDASMSNMRHDRFKTETGDVDIRTLLLLENVIPTFSAAMVRSSLLRTIDLLSPVPQWVDWWIWIQVAQLTQFVYVPEHLTVWRRHQANYNRSYSFFNYLNIFNKMRNGINGLLSARQYSLSKCQRLIVNLPDFLILFIRMLKIWRYGGMQGLYARIASKIMAQKQLIAS
jgi:glycosyltransferase involved in cell wall biosynthesis